MNHLKCISLIALFFYLGFSSCTTYKPFYVRSGASAPQLPALDTEKSYRVVLDDGRKIQNTAWTSLDVSPSQIVVKEKYSQRNELIRAEQVKEINLVKTDALKTTFLAGGIGLGVLAIVTLGLIVNGFGEANKAD